MREPTQEEVLAFFDAIKARFNLHVISKDDSTQMKLVGELLEAMGIQDAETFKKNYWTTLPFDAHRLDGPTMYVPFSMRGAVWAREDCWPRSAVPWHEAPGHVHRFKVVGALTFAVTYIVDSQTRAREETYALGLTKSAHWWRYGAPLDDAALAGVLREYGCTGRNVALAEEGLRSVDPMLEQGGAVNDDDLWCRTWWEKNAPDVQADRLR